MQKKYFFNMVSPNKKNEQGNFLLSSVIAASSKWCVCFLTLLCLLSSPDTNAQITYTLGNGTTSSNALGVSPFATINRNERCQYLFYGQELVDSDAINGNIISLALNITQLGTPAMFFPENVTIKMKLTSKVVLGTELEPGLPVYYTSAVEKIEALGWHTFTLDTPFEWDGYSNILVEICRNNSGFGTSFAVESKLNNVSDYRTVGLYSNDTDVAGCDLTGTTDMTNANRRTRPNAQFTMTNPCSGTPTPGTTVVSAGPYCDGSPFQLSIQDGSTESGLYYQWQHSPNDNGPWTDIIGATNTTYQTSQATATYYRRQTTCIESQETINSLGVLVDSEGCYCTALVLLENEIGITNVTFNELNNSSTSEPRYTNFTSKQTDVKRDEVYILSARVSTVGGTNYTKAWIDWNRNGEYDENEGYNLGIAKGTDVNSSLPQSITVPTDAVLGAINMRIRTSQSQDDSYPAACGPIANGEGEDYTINIIEANLGVNQFKGSANEVLVYKEQNGLVVAMQNEVISDVKVYDLSGRLLMAKNQINEKTTTIDTLKSNRQVLIFQISTQSGTVIYKKVIL